MSGYKAAARLKVDDSEYVERGESVSEGDFDKWDTLVASKTVVTDEQYAQMFPEVQQGANQASGTPSNLEQIEGTKLQVNLPEEGDEVPATRVPEANPADPPHVEGATDPGDPDVTVEYDDDEDDES